ncbi:MAG: DUF2922 domain-containing protein [Clostridium sp.]|uniref:DUF2922 domain-containing protein n=1 Tax=Clostridium sp. TaxID=1506 RepID=UPI0025BC8328|nr:DUF2922 domain-containing protein [Clostridium sp.]MCI6691893.1 DUF2922 domain-containing protein [Clostridium sp.]MDY2629736.1 DUF2922 domain-containing protein [Clostridium sp.]MDY4253619.1 DUF2922 domain-containing protein [Clostridium sp.]MDY6227975.1 DUF2922 domain-containing protein [Clostridium sp.]
MIARTASMSFKDISGKKLTLSVKDIKENVDNSAVVALMDTIINKKLIKTEAGDLVEKQAAQIVVKNTTEVEF